MTTILGEGSISKTRKPHRCCVCGVFIPIGSPANWQTNTGGDWDFGTVYWHTDCELVDMEES